MSRLFFASDIHGSLPATEAILTGFHKFGCDKLILLGDILYHGPRNDLPEGYNPKAVIEKMNEEKNSILAVRGNCDTEVDQMVLSFPLMADYGFLSVDGLSIYLTHGHKYSPDCPPPLAEGDILISGHTHIPGFGDFGNRNIAVNPGSCAIPKGGFAPSYMIYESKRFTIYSLDGKILFSREL